VSDGSLYGRLYRVGTGTFKMPANSVHKICAARHSLSFPPLDPDENKDDEPISVKKLKQGDGMWSTKKEILGWLFDGVGRCIQLPMEKVEKTTQMLKDMLRKR